jgi:hypothetical protein
MCTNCLSTQAAYNAGKDDEDAQPFTDNNGAQSKSGSVNEQGLPNAQDERFEGTKADTTGNPNIGKQGFGV